MIYFPNARLRYCTTNPKGNGKDSFLKNDVITPEEAAAKIKEVEAAAETANNPTKQKLTDEEVLAIAKADFEIAKENKKQINDKVSDFRKLYNGEPLGNETDGRSKYVAKEAQKAVNWWIPNAMKPFMSANDIVDFMPRTADDIEKAKSQNVLVNYQFNNDFPKYQFLHTSLQLYSSEGTVVARTGWLHEEETEVVPFQGLTDQEVYELSQSGAEIDIEESALITPDALNDAYRVPIKIHKGTATITKTTVSRPDAAPLKFENFYIIGETIEDSDCCIERIDTNRSDLRLKDKKYNDNGIYENVDNIITPGLEAKDAGLAQEREEQLREYGQESDKNQDNRSREEITIYEYYGNIDRDGDGIAEPIVVVWSGNTILRISENPFPDKEPPYVGAPFSPIPFSFHGNGLPYFLEDITKVKTAIMRTFIDLMANSTNGMKHVQKGTIDNLNIRRLREAKIGTVVEWDDINGKQDDIKNDIPGSLQNMYELFTGEGENESGITRYNQGIDAKSLNKTATGITAIMNQSQMRTWETVTRFAEQYMKPLFRKWIAYNKEFLDTDIAVRVVGGKYTSISKDDIKGNFDLSINVAIAGSEEAKSQKIIQMLQMVQPLVQAGALPPHHITKLIGELEELWGFKDLAEELKQMVEQSQQPEEQPGQPGEPGQLPPGQPIQ